jgi:hypothetical protein
MRALDYPRFGVLGLGLWLFSCAASQGSEAAKPRDPGGSAGGSGGSGGSSPVGNGSGGSGPGVNVTDSGGTGGGPVGETCAMASAEGTLMKEPVDIILVLDNSGSMADELQAVEDNINVNFASILQASGVDYRVILLSRHRKEARAPSGESSTSICVSAPLSGLDPCPGPTPVLAERFFHYNEKVESTDSFDWIISAYNRADMRSSLTQIGYSEWLRPGAKKVFLEMTDDNEDMTADTFITLLQALGPQHFGSDPAHPNFVFHSIIGIKEKADPTAAYLPTEPLEAGVCTSNANDVANAGSTYQDLSIRTGGLRFPLCQFTAYDVVFSTIANDVATRTTLACDFAIPELPDDQTLELDNVAVSYTAGAAAGGAVIKFGQAKTSAECQANAFYIENDRIYLCPESCDQVKSDGMAQVDVLFTCESQIIVVK